MKIGLVVNPVAGMGGAVGLKGTDGEAVQAEAIKRGAVQIAPGRAVNALRTLRDTKEKFEILTCSGQMGEDELAAAAVEGEIIHRSSNEPSREDTIAACKEFVRRRVEMLIFTGGDGTARDVLEGVRDSVPMIGIPAGVKMHSAVFLNQPEDLGVVLESFAMDGATKTAEVLDINEDLFRRGVVDTKLYGIAIVPDDRVHVQASKMADHSGTATDEAKEIGQYVADSIENDTLYIVGPGSTTAAIFEVLGLRKTLLGVDVIMNGQVIKSDAAEADILELLERGKRAKIVVSPIGAQGFFFGRGNQQISSSVIGKVGYDDIVVVATPTKLRETPWLRTDTGDRDIDSRLRGRIKVITGYRRKKLVEVR